jgi:hypothetical protein
MTQKKDVPHYGTQIGIMRNIIKDAFVVALILALVALLLAYYHCGGWVYLPAIYSGIYLLLSLSQYIVWKNAVKEFYKSKTPA